ncbi:MAG: peptidylprolyl isomerase [Bacteroidia bacterium]|nr:peptidylprolyl isomerase [Bacteroidia bacterium]MCX7763755.1 peptidylprolyl isomerase [Bacteroidia bacterium]MDW8058244.1 peptidylprolyl isomerase [Bacteroidia bacterium]
MQPSFTKAQLRLEGIAAVVGDEIILESQVRQQYAYLKQSGVRDDGGLYCEVLEQFIIQKLLLVRARLDSLKVSDEQVERELDRRIQIITAQLGSPEAVVEIYGKPLPVLKQELRTEIRNQLLAEEMRQKITADVKVTPKEVRDFYESIPSDSIPFIPAEVELSQIVFWAKPSPLERERTKEKLEEIRREIMAGKMEFSSAARAFSQDLASARQGGDLGEFTKGRMVPEFERMAFSVPIGEVSPVFETPFGFHILLVEKRTGNKVKARHILLQPTITEADVEEAKQRLSILREQILRDSITFTRAATEFSEDLPSKQTGGRFMDEETGSYRIPLDQLDPELYFVVDRLKPGEVSEPSAFTSRDGRRGVRIVWLQRKYAPHRASLELDYERFAQAALQLKKQEAIERWLQRARKNVHVEIRTPRCEEALSTWEQPTER